MKSLFLFFKFYFDGWSVGIVDRSVGSPRTRSVVGVRGPGVSVFGFSLWEGFSLPILACKIVTLHGKTGKKVMTRARYFNTLDKRKFL